MYTNNTVMIIALEQLFDVNLIAHRALVEKMQEPWEIIPRLKEYIARTIQAGNHGRVVGNTYIDEQVQIGEGTVVEHGACILGPTIIGRNCVVRAGAYIRAFSLIEDGCVIGHASEIKNSWLMQGAHAAHFNYVGDSVIGRNVNLAAGALCANVRLDPHTVSIKHNGERIDTGLKKFGALVGDDSKIGCNVVLNPGTLIGKNSKIYPALSISGMHQSSSKISVKG
ncbi:MAG: hypothetical protein UX10_C0035G0008 [Candidatus Magasanikbacteria bacterium GW2011_GWA2_45_39]|uniref:Mannose-1-phosphate guanyltransferase C-terminal domain-containing protein n=1 Tax=Candidatus Magasanikbacteria bacterium GW2011_GWA2_45_39 TaxID=1619041 RepID=A0A0G1ME16_9BACT|nr:MAG: hypothetical protein UX10_C0035G0008 [Candidatus Magasanikbacteria bacterium GW2011_GWA2_45_39]